MPAVLPNPSSLRVVMFSNLYPPVVSGSSTQSSRLARELVHKGCQVAMITSRLTSAQPEYEHADGVHVYRLPTLRLPRLAIALNFPWLNYTFTPGNLRRIDTIVRRHHPHVLHLHNHMFDLAFSAVLLRYRYRIPLLCTIHTKIKHSNSLFNLLLIPADRLLLRHCVIRHASLLLCPDTNMQAYVRDAFHCHNSFLLPYGIELYDPPPLAKVRELRQQYGLDNKRVLLSLGHVHEIRNRKDLIEALPHVLKVIPNLVLLIVGAVATQTPLHLAQQLGVSETVRFTGPVPHALVPAFLALADLEAHWLNQDRPEQTSLGVASMEAMGAGKTVLAAANVNTFEPGILRQNENLVLVEPGQPEQLAPTLIHLLCDDARRLEIGRRARQTIRESFSWEAISERTLRTYEDVCCLRSNRPDSRAA